MTELKKETIAEQYKSSDNLEARINLHRRFSTSKENWHEWLWKHCADFPPQARILEVGCGSGTLWQRVIDRVPAEWDITLTDFSSGMLEDARHNLAEHAARFTFQVMDAQDIPFDDATFDAVIANHMLYHVPDRPKALAQIRRVLKPNGVLIAATNGQNHMRELDVLLMEVFPEYEAALREIEHSLLVHHHSFQLENGGAQLQPFFGQVTMHPYEGGLVVTETEPLLRYCLSATWKDNLSDTEIMQLHEAIEARIQRDGAVRIQTVTGVFVCRP